MGFRKARVMRAGTYCHHCGGGCVPGRNVALRLRRAYHVKGVSMNVQTVIRSICRTCRLHSYFFLMLAMVLSGCSVSEFLALQPLEICGRAGAQRVCAGLRVEMEERQRDSVVVRPGAAVADGGG